MKKRISHWIDTLTQIAWCDAILIMLGALMLSEFYLQLTLGTFSGDGLYREIISITQESSIPIFWQYALLSLLPYTNLLAPFLGVLFLFSGVFLTLLLFRAFSGLLASALLFIAWLSYWNYPGIWTFEYLMPAVIGLFASLSALGKNSGGKTLNIKLFGLRFFHKLSFNLKLLITLFSSSLLGYFMYLSKNAVEQSLFIALISAFTFGVLFFTSSLIDHYRLEKIKTASTSLLVNKIKNFDWESAVIMSIGAMLVMQVYSNFFVHWFTVEGYSGLAHMYANQTSAPAWMKAFLNWTGDHAAIFLPIQIIMETSFAVLLSLLILRGPVLLLAFGLFAILTFTEFGVSARWPAHAGDPTTWVWELLFITMTALFLGLHQTAIMLKTKGIKNKVLGSSLFGNLSLQASVLITLSGGALLGFIGISTHVFGNPYVHISIATGVTFSIILFISIFIIQRELLNTSSLPDPQNPNLLWVKS